MPYGDPRVRFEKLQEWRTGLYTLKAAQILKTVFQLESCKQFGGRNFCDNFDAQTIFSSDYAWSYSHPADVVKIADDGELYLTELKPHYPSSSIIRSDWHAARRRVSWRKLENLVTRFISRATQYFTRWEVPTLTARGPGKTTLELSYDSSTETFHAKGPLFNQSTLEESSFTVDEVRCLAAALSHRFTREELAELYGEGLVASVAGEPKDPFLVCFTSQKRRCLEEAIEVFRAVVKDYWKSRGTGALSHAQPADYYMNVKDDEDHRISNAVTAVCRAQLEYQDALKKVLA